MADEEVPELDEIGEPWANAEYEYIVLRDLAVPEARERFYSVMNEWTALDTKALGILAVDAAAIGVLATVHSSVNHLWWLPAAGFSVAGALLIGVVWVRGIALGPDLLDFHHKMRNDPPLHAAREMLNDLVTATDENDSTVNGKTSLFWWALASLAVSLIGCLPITLFRPG